MHETQQKNASQAGNILTVTGELNPQQTYTELWMQDGKVIRILTSQLASEATAGPAASEADDHRDAADFEKNRGEESVIPVIDERLEVGRRSVKTATVRLQKVVQEYQEMLDEPLAVRTFDIERIIVNKPVEAAPSVRQEGDTTIYSLVEEQMILTKQLVLKEELRVTRRDTERRDRQVVTLRREHLIVEREAHEGGSATLPDEPTALGHSTNED